MAWFTLYLLNLLWALAGTSTQTRSSCCKYSVFPDYVREADTQGTGGNLRYRFADKKVVKKAITIRAPKWVSHGGRVWFIFPDLIVKVL